MPVAISKSVLLLYSASVDISRQLLTRILGNAKNQTRGRCERRRPIIVHLVMDVVVATEVDVRTPFVVKVAVVALAVEDAGPVCQDLVG